jgi:hypothetical protein
LMTQANGGSLACRNGDFGFGLCSSHLVLFVCSDSSVAKTRLILLS